MHQRQRYWGDNLFYFHDALKMGSAESDVGIITLWTPRETIAKHLTEEDYAVIGNLYSKDLGISTLLRNWAQNKSIRHIVLCGQDSTSSGEALKSLFAHGIDIDHRIVNANAVIEKEIPREAIDEFRKNVQLLDLRHIGDYSKLKTEIKKLQKLQPAGQSERFPEATVLLPAVFPSEPGIHLRAKTVGECWLQILHSVMKFGIVKPSAHGESQKELLGLLCVISAEPPNQPAWKPYLLFSKEELENYIPQAIAAITVKDVSYTYGQRLRNYRGIDQVKGMAEELRNAVHSRRAVAVTWDVEKDMNSPEPPCLDLVQALVQEGKLHLTAYFRSNDMFDAWPKNAFALRRLQGNLCKELCLGVGSLITISNSAHIYSRSFANAARILKDYPLPENMEFELPGNFLQDPRGNLLIQLAERKIRVSHLHPEGQKIDEMDFPTAREAMLWLYYEHKVSDIAHAIYAGIELQKAEFALQNKLPYVQDKPLVLK